MYACFLCIKTHLLSYLMFCIYRLENIAVYQDNLSGCMLFLRFGYLLQQHIEHRYKPYEKGLMICFVSITDIHQIVLMSRIDLVRASIRKNPCHIFQSKEVEEKLDNFKDRFRLNKNRFLPTMNYTEEMYPRTEIDYMTLYNLLQMMNGANDYLKYIVQNQRQT